jgi:hypothetical protein
MNHVPAHGPERSDDPTDEPRGGSGRLALFIGIVLVGIVIVLAFGGEYANPIRHFLSNLLRRMF